MSRVERAWPRTAKMASRLAFSLGVSFQAHHLHDLALELLARLVVPRRAVGLLDARDRLLEVVEDPEVHLGEEPPPLRPLQGVLLGVVPVLLSVLLQVDVEVVECVEDLIRPSRHLLGVEAQRVHRRALPDHVVAEEVHRPVCEHLVRVEDVPQALAHLPALLVEDVPLEEEGPVGRDRPLLVDDVQDEEGVRPAPRLVDPLGEVAYRDELLPFGVGERGEGGGAAVVPSVQDEGLPAAVSPALRAPQDDPVYPGPVELELLPVGERLRLLDDAPAREGRDLLLAVGADPDRERGPPDPLP
jgi:hypothetical protein